MIPTLLQEVHSFLLDLGEGSVSTNPGLVDSGHSTRLTKVGSTSCWGQCPMGFSYDIKLCFDRGVDLHTSKTGWRKGTVAQKLFDICSCMAAIQIVMGTVMRRIAILNWQDGVYFL